MSQCEYNADTFLRVYKLQSQYRPTAKLYVSSLLPQGNDTFTSPNYTLCLILISCLMHNQPISIVL